MSIAFTSFGRKILVSTAAEKAEVADKSAFLAWMREESAAVPATEEECAVLLRSWLRHRRKGVR